MYLTYPRHPRKYARRIAFLTRLSKILPTTHGINMARAKTNVENDRTTSGRMTHFVHFVAHQAMVRCVRICSLPIGLLPWMFCRGSVRQCRPGKPEPGHPSQSRCLFRRSTLLCSIFFSLCLCPGHFCSRLFAFSAAPEQEICPLEPVCLFCPQHNARWLLLRHTNPQRRHDGYRRHTFANPCSRHDPFESRISLVSGPSLP